MVVNVLFLFDLLPYVHDKQLRSCQDSHLLNHTVLRQFTSCLVPILSPLTDNLPFLNQRKREKILHERMCWTQGSILCQLRLAY